MCRIKFKETFRINVGLHDLSLESYFIKTLYFKKKKIFFTNFFPYLFLYEFFFYVRLVRKKLAGYLYYVIIIVTLVLQKEPLPVSGCRSRCSTRVRTSSSGLALNILLELLKKGSSRVEVGRWVMS